MNVKYNDCMSIRIEKNLKKDFETFCMNSGMTVSGAVNLLVRNTIKKEQIPFQVVASVNDVPMGKYEGGDKQTLRTSIRIDREIRADFAKICGEIGISMSRLIKMFMVNCIKNNRLPF